MYSRRQTFTCALLLAGVALPGCVEEDFERVWLRRNIAGRELERWFHATGCRRWLTLERDTETNEVHGIR